jgi:hypothetical protein
MTKQGRSNIKKNFFSLEFDFKIYLNETKNERVSDSPSIEFLLRNVYFKFFLV